ncbi:hypothetical protein B0T25DRAFT_478138 [Lasiosphaeria hispida]|uniref:Trafficking protein particle complex subunit 12 n=1 Tax=Lasiosphaeria hispida TaxID=260671 RepID=A0AAJ0HH55_9PEZI|nr:hypothetical protein B0T25DRAFT_478138 [Lasiosphaeria hispida]
MDPTKDDTPKGHTRTRSAVKATRPRASTKGPLDAVDVPLTSPLSPQQQQLTHHQPSPQPSQRMAPPIGPSRSPVPILVPGPISPFPRSAAPSPAPRRLAARPKDFSYLLRPDLYHAVPAVNVPAAFRVASAKQPGSDTPIAELLKRGQFRAAAAAAAHALTTPGVAPDPGDHVAVFGLLYTRLACLMLVDATAQAAQEVKAFEDLNSVFYLDEATGVHLVPWALRVLIVRLQAMGFGDPRRAVMGYYELAREARGRLGEAMVGHDNSGRELWKERLADLGVRVAGALVEMDDLTGAAQHLASLKEGRESGKLTMAKALLWLHLGDAEAARRVVKAGEMGEKAEKVVAALCDMADGEYGAALARWEELDEQSKDEMIGVNRAVCLLYVGKMQEGKTLLEGLVASGRASHTLLFNLTTMYELCTEKARDLKIKLSETVAAMDESPSGWEKANADFKL